MHKVSLFMHIMIKSALIHASLVRSDGGELDGTCAVEIFQSTLLVRGATKMQEQKFI